MRAHVGLFHALRTTNVGSTQLHAGDDCADRLHVAGRWQRVDDVAIEHLRALRVLHVYERSLAGHRDAFFERTDAKLDVDGNGCIARKFDAVTNERGETRQRERHLISAGSQIDQRVATGFVADDRPCLLDEHRACGFHGHARQHRTAYVANDTGNRALRMRDGRQQHETAQGCQHRRCQSRQRSQAFCSGAIRRLRLSYAPPHTAS